jgi:FK506-binding nuclear protein
MAALNKKLKADLEDDNMDIDGAVNGKKGKGKITDIDMSDEDEEDEDDEEPEEFVLCTLTPDSVSLAML